MSDETRDTRDENTEQDAFWSGEGQLGDPAERDTNGNDEHTVVDEPVRDGLDNAVENSEVRGARLDLE